MKLNEEHLDVLLQAWGEAERAAHPRGGSGEATLDAAPPEGRLPIRHTLEPQELDLTISAEADGVALHFEGRSPRWAGALLHCRWTWTEENGEEERITGFMCLDPVGFRGRYDGRVSGLTPRLTWAPDWARLDPQTADPEHFGEALTLAQFKPTLTVLQDWLRQHQDLGPTQRKEWEAALADLMDGEAAGNGRRAVPPP